MIKSIVKKLDKKRIKKHSHSSQELDNEKENQLSNASYNNLEKLLQKYEGEIREHIRIEQQLKIYSESLEEKIDGFQKKMENIKKKYDTQKYQMQGYQLQQKKLKKELEALWLDRRMGQKRIINNSKW